LLTIHSLNTIKIILFCIKFLKQAHTSLHWSFTASHHLVLCESRESAFPLFQTASWSFCYPCNVLAPVSQLKLTSLHEDYRACTKQGCRHTGGWVCMCTRREMGSAPTGRERGSEGGNRSGYVCPCAKVRRQHPVTSRSSTRAHRPSRGRIESAILRICRELLWISNDCYRNEN